MQSGALTSRPATSTCLTALPDALGPGKRHYAVSLPAGMLTLPPGHNLAIRQHDTLYPVQVRPLGRDAEGRPRWLRLESVVEQGPCDLLSGIEASFEQPLEVRQDEGCLSISNGHVTVQVPTGSVPTGSPLLQIGRPDAMQVDASAVVRSEGKVYYACHAGTDQGSAAKLIAEGPARVEVQIEGEHRDASGHRLLSFRVTAEVYADLPTVALRYWFFNLEPGRGSIPIEAIELVMGTPSAVGSHAVVQSQHGLTAVPRLVTTDRPLDARVGEENNLALRLADDAPLNDDTDYPPYLMPPLDLVEPWLGTKLNHGSVAMTVDDLPQLQPKGLRVDDEGFKVDVWPSWAPTLDLQQGRSRSVTARLTFFDQAIPSSPSEVTRQFVATRCVQPPLLNPDAYRDAGVFGQDAMLATKSKGARRFDDYLRKVACPPTVCDFFDLGDTIDPGYSRTYLGTGRRLQRTVPDNQYRPIQFLTNRYAAEHSDLSQFEKVWANNEYDVIWCIGGEMMRSHRPELFQSLRWFCRHAIEVDFVHYSDHPVKHRSTPPHCARHTTAGTYPSHLWTEGLLQYYALSGDEDALAFARGLGDKIVEMLSDPQQKAKLWNPTRELGWALLALAALCEFDPSPRYMQMAGEIADELIRMPLADENIETIVRFAFGYASIALGLDRWHGIAGERRHAEWLATLAEKCAHRMLDDSGVESAMSLNILHVGVKHGADPSVLVSGMRTLERIIDSKAWHDPPPYTKPFAMLWRPLSRFFADAHRQGLLKPLDYRY